jgi:MFS transporter, MHS family, proline/betaine transporter
MVATAAPEEAARTQRRPAIIAGVIGSVLEWYDWAVYAYFVPSIAALFFPAGGPLAPPLMAWATFAAGYLMRPLGAIVFGGWGDRVGRRSALAAAMATMAVATGLVGMLPTFASAGYAATLLLVASRLLQGFAVGGGSCGITAYLVEFAPPGRRGFFGSWQQVSVAAGLTLGSGIAALMNQSALIGQDALLAWGWRLPFLLGTAVGGVAAYLRWATEETPHFRAPPTPIPASPLGAALAEHRRETLAVFGMTLHNTIDYYLVLSFVAKFLTASGSQPPGTAQTVGTLGLLLFIALIPVAGALSDRLGRKPLLTASCLGYLALTLPLIWLAGSGSLVLAVAAQLAFAALLALYAGASPAAYAELFPVRVRYTALSLGYNTAVALFGGTASLVGGMLTTRTGWAAAPALYVMAAALVSLLVVRRRPETAFLPLR